MTGRKVELAGARPDARVDERETMFARMAREPDTEAYRDYYERRPELQKGDDHLRSLPRLVAPGGSLYEPEAAEATHEYFRRIAEIEVEPTVVEVWKARLEGGANRTVVVEALLREYGAVAVGCTPLDSAYVYTHKGRLDEDYGEAVELDHPSAIVFLVEMDFEAMQRAPHLEVIVESARQYFLAARASKVLEAVLLACGYRAKAHYDAHYDVILPPLAVNAGLGELGRNNILIADRYGSRVRIGAVSTDCEVEYAEPISLGADAFCETCKKCADNCPSRSLTTGGKEMVRGVAKWPTRVETCYAYWRSVGSDCGICMSCCPFSHRNNWFHNAVRRVLMRCPWLRRPALFLDDLVYGRRWKPR